AAPRASAACRWFGTQLECDLGASRVTIGTQVADEPSYARGFPTYSFHRDRGLPDDQAASRRPFEIELQDFAADPSLCRKIGNEPYCYGPPARPADRGALPLRVLGTCRYCGTRAEVSARAAPGRRRPCRAILRFQAVCRPFHPSA